MLGTHGACVHGSRCQVSDVIGFTKFRDAIISLERECFDELVPSFCERSLLDRLMHLQAYMELFFISPIIELKTASEAAFIDQREMKTRHNVGLSCFEEIACNRFLGWQRCGTHVTNEPELHDQRMPAIQKSSSTQYMAFDRIKFILLCSYGSAERTLFHQYTIQAFEFRHDIFDDISAHIRS